MTRGGGGRCSDVARKADIALRGQRFHSLRQPCVRFHAAAALLMHTAWAAVDAAAGSRAGVAADAAPGGALADFSSPLNERSPEPGIKPITWMHVPVTVQFNAEHPARSRVRMCVLDWERYHAGPAVMPMFEDVVELSACRSRDDSEATRRRDEKEVKEALEAAAPEARSKAFTPSSTWTTLGDLEAEYEHRGCAEAALSHAHVPGCALSGVLFHESRCGSTLAANMLASMSSVLMYSESGPPNIIIRQEALSVRDRAHWLRVLIAAMSRPIVAAAAGMYKGEWQPKYVYIKTQHTTSLWLDVYQTAFPRMPWIYIHREPVEVLMSLLRDGPSAPSPNAPLTEHIDERHLPFVNNTPCIRSRVTVPLYLQELTGVQRHAAGAYPTEDWCAQDLAWVMASALRASIIARRTALARAMHFADGSSNIDYFRRAMEVDVTNGTAFAAAIQSAAGSCVIIRDGMVLDAASETGVVMGVGLGLFVDYKDLPLIVPLLLDTHLRPMSTWVAPKPVSSTPDRVDACFSADLPITTLGWGAQLGRGGVASDFVLSPDDVDIMMAASSMYSKSRATKEQLAALRHAPGGIRPFQRTGNGRLRAARAWTNIDVNGKYVSDVSAKHAFAWPALRYAAAKYMTDIRNVMLGFNVPFESAPSNGTADVLPAQSRNASEQSAPAPTIVTDISEAELLEGLGSVVKQCRSSASPACMTFIATPIKRRAGGADPVRVTSRISAPANVTVVQESVIDATAATYSADLVPFNEPGAYPQLYPLDQMLSEWSIDIISPPGIYGKFTSIRALRYDNNHAFVARAAEFRDAGLPFAVRDIPALSDAVQAWSNDSMVLHLLGAFQTYNIEVSDHKHIVTGGRPGHIEPTIVYSFAEGMYKLSVLETWHVPEWLRRAMRWAEEYADEERDQLPTWWAETEPSSPRGMEINRYAPDIDWYGPLPATIRMHVAKLLDSTNGVVVPEHLGVCFPPEIVQLYGLPTRRARVPPLTRAKRRYVHMRIDWAGRPDDPQWIPMHVPVLTHPTSEPAAAAAEGLFADANRGAASHNTSCRLWNAAVNEVPHVLSTDTWLVSLRGYLRVILVPPEECWSARLGDAAPLRGRAKRPWLQLEDLSQLHGLHATEFVLEPGDAMYVPAYWTRTLVALTVAVVCESDRTPRVPTPYACKSPKAAASGSSPLPTLTRLRNFPQPTTASLYNLTALLAYSNAVIGQRQQQVANTSTVSLKPRAHAPPTPLPAIPDSITVRHLFQLLGFEDVHMQHRLPPALDGPSTKPSMQGAVETPAGASVGTSSKPSAVRSHVVSASVKRRSQTSAAATSPAGSRPPSSSKAKSEAVVVSVSVRSSSTRAASARAPTKMPSRSSVGKASVSARRSPSRAPAAVRVSSTRLAQRPIKKVDPDAYVHKPSAARQAAAAVVTPAVEHLAGKPTPSLHVLAHRIDAVQESASATTLLLQSARWLLLSLTFVVCALAVRWHVMPRRRCCCTRPGKPTGPRISIKFA